MIKVANSTTNEGFRKVMYENVIVSYKRVKNDIYGNPLYRVYPINFSFKPLKYAYRNYKNDTNGLSYYLLQSYNINTDIENLINEYLETVKDNKEFDTSLFNKYHYQTVETLNDQK
ncbi:hypothetical protein [Enterococcus casseliflavus]|uniref:hypothetical protein n=1 Tax=Enterococcus casseliflavus TaxID=37734 RepID=UPI003017FD9C